MKIELERVQYKVSSRCEKCFLRDCGTLCEMATVVIVLTIFLSLVAVGVGRECPPWLEWVNSTSDSSGYCACAPALGNHIICNQKSQQSFLISGSCVFYDTKTDCVMTTECRRGEEAVLWEMY